MAGLEVSVDEMKLTHTGKHVFGKDILPNRILTLQGHPEYNESIMTCLLNTRNNRGIFGDETYRSGMARAGNQHDGEFVGK
ncbi:hypothetical protein NUU61_003611, partial [Penicillium alfredii]